MRGRQLRSCSSATVLVVAAFSTAIRFLFFLVYLFGGAARRLAVVLPARAAGLRAGYHVLNPRAQVGRACCTRCIGWTTTRAGPSRGSRSATNARCRIGLPGRVIGIGSRSSRQWLAKVNLLRQRGSYRIGAMRVRTGDPFGLFTRR